MSKVISQYRRAVLGVKTASLASRNVPHTRNPDGSIKPREQREAERAARARTDRVEEAKPKSAPKSKSKASKKPAPKKPAKLKAVPPAGDAPAAPATEQTTETAAAVVTAANGAHVDDTPTEALAAAESFDLPLALLIAALTIAPSDEVRPYLNGVYVHQLEDRQVRVVATDGHRLMVSTLAADRDIAWARAGVILPRDALQRIVRYVGKDAESLSIEYGVGHPTLTVREVAGMATFAFAPCEGRYPDYQRIVDSSAGVFTAEREELTVTTFNAKYLKSATVVAAALGASGIIPFLAADDKAPSVFAFEGFEGALLYVMPAKSREIALPAQTVKLYGAGMLEATLAGLEAQIEKTRANAKSAKHDKFREQFKAKAERLQARADSLRAALSVKLTGPTAASDQATTGNPPPPAASKPQLSVVH